MGNIAEFLGDLAGIACIGGIFHHFREKERAEEMETQRRQNCPCLFNDGVSEEEFEEFAYSAVRLIKKRRVTISVSGPIIYGTVVSNTGLTQWDFTIDFNDYGHITGQYWIWSENEDSTIPSNIAKTISYRIY